MAIDPALFRENERTRPTEEGRRTQAIGDLTLESGETLSDVEIAYETFGENRGDNVVWVCHALTGDSHAVGWWSRLVGPGRVVDTDRYHVVCANVIGGCQGSTGPLTRRPFPQVTIGDMVGGHERLRHVLGYGPLRAVIGGSMGGFQAIEWARRFPEAVERCFASACSARHGGMQIGYNEAQRQAIRRDPKWRDGAYPLDDPPRDGMAVARMIGHLTFLSERAFETKFGRRIQDDGTGRFQVESYLNYQGDKFTDRFDANTMMLFLRAVDQWNAPNLQGATARFLFASYTSDWLYPPRDVEELHRMALAAGCESRHVTIDLPYGHDAFLLDGERQGEALRELLESPR